MSLEHKYRMIKMNKSIEYFAGLALTENLRHKLSCSKWLISLHSSAMTEKKNWYGALLQRLLFFTSPAIMEMNLLNTVLLSLCAYCFKIVLRCILSSGWNSNSRFISSLKLPLF